MNPQALVELILGLEPEAQALITLLVKHLHRKRNGAPSVAGPSNQGASLGDHSSAAPAVPLPTTVVDASSTARDPDALTPDD